MIMKKVLILCAVGVAFGLSSRAQTEGSVSELCIGSGVHCATLTYGTVKMTFVKGRNAPGIRIKETK
jgi:hypothetical protein